VREVVLVPAGFHPRFNIDSREYIYRLAVLRNAASFKPIEPKNASDLISYLPITDLYRVLPLRWAEHIFIV